MPPIRQSKDKNATNSENLDAMNSDLEVAMTEKSKQTNKRKREKPITESGLKGNKKKRNKSTSESEVTVTARIQDTDECVDMEVDGIQTDFMSEIEEEDIAEFEGSEVVFNFRSSTNNNATLSDKIGPLNKQDKIEAGKSSQCNGPERNSSVQNPVNQSQAKEVYGGEQNMSQKEIDEEEAFFDRISIYMQKKGIIGSTCSMKSGGQQGEKLQEKKRSTAGMNNKAGHGGDRERGIYEHEHERRNNLPAQSNSEAMIYQSAVKRVMPNNNNDIEQTDIGELAIHRDSSSSEDENMNASNETNETMEINEINDMTVMFTDTKKMPRREKEDRDKETVRHRRNSTQAVDRRREEITREAERGKAHIFEVKGKESTYLHTALIDEGYVMMGTHLDTGTKQKIEEGQYVDLARLLPRDKVRTEDDHRLEMVNKGELTYWIPMADRDLSPINSYIRWEQVFRVYTNVFAKANPNRVTEILQYNHTIELAVTSFHWNDIYQYDREFRIHMGENPERNWGIILQQGWSIYLKNPINNNAQAGSNRSEHNQNSSAIGKKICFRYNRGHCSFGLRCKFDHHCGINGKHGHGAFNCRWVIDSDRDKGHKGSGKDYDRNGGQKDKDYQWSCRH